MFAVVSDGPAGPLVEYVGATRPTDEQVAEYAGYQTLAEMVADADSISRDAQGRIEDVRLADGDVWYAVRRSVR